MNPCWSEILSSKIEQGDLLVACELPRIPTESYGVDATGELVLDQVDVIVMTQTCQIEQEKIKNVVLCRVVTVAKFNQDHPEISTGKLKGFWSNVRNGRDDRLHLMHAPADSEKFDDLLVVDFREIYTAPVTYVQAFVKTQKRSRLLSPYLEQMAQRFGYYFSKVALPIDLPTHP